MRSDMQDPIVTLRNMFNTRLKDKNNNDVEVVAYWSEEVIRKYVGTGVQVWVAIGNPAGTTPKDDWLSLPAMGYRRYRSWRYPIYVGGWDRESVYLVTRKILEIIRNERTAHTNHPEYIEFMYVEGIQALDRQYEETTPPLIHFIIFVVMEWLEL